MEDEKCAPTLSSCANTNEYLDMENNVCVVCLDNCLMCDSDGCIECEDGYGPMADSTACGACESTPEGLKTCTDDKTTADKCEEGYGNIAGTCTICTVDNCMNCDSGAA